MTVKAPQRARKPKPAPRSGFKAALGRLGLARWPRRRVVLAGVLLIAATGIAVNALVLQSSRHPAPLFAAVEAARRSAASPPPLPPNRPAETAAAASPAPAPAARAAAPASSGDEQAVARIAAGAPEKPQRPAAERPAAEKPAPKPAPAEVVTRPAGPKADPLADLIRGGIVPPAAIPSEADPRIVQIQKNLARLGHAGVKPDGFMGPATKAAIEKFERDRKWPVTGEISPRLIRELGMVSASRP